MQLATANSLKKQVLVISLAGLLVACGTRPGDRALTGGLLGAATGAAITAATGGTIWAGALIGGAVGAVTGAATSPRTVNLGRPVWRHYDR